MLSEAVSRCPNGSEPVEGAAPPAERTLPAQNGAEALVRLLAAQDVEYIFLNPGSDTAPVQEALVALAAQGVRVPQIRLCPSENVALSAAHGYWLLTGKVQVVMVHVDVGIQSLGAALHNAQRAHVGVVIIAGKAPRTYDGELPGGRTITVQWQQDQPDLAGIARGFVKWNEELTPAETFATLVPRAFQVAAARPSGPVLMTVAREALMRSVDGVRIIPPARRRVPVPPMADSAAIATAAAWLGEARNPVIVAGRVGRSSAAVEQLSALCDLVAIPVVDYREYLNLPSDHPCYLRSPEEVTAALTSADVVLVLDAEVPWVPLVSRPPDDARVIQIDVDPVKQTLVNWGFSIDLPIQADSAKALSQLYEQVEGESSAEARERWADRRAALHRSKAAVSHAREIRLGQLARQRSVAPEFAIATLDRLLPDHAVVMEEATTNELVVREYLTRALPGTIFAIGAAGLGWAMGAALGAKLSNPDAQIVAICGDGSFIFSSPVAALWAARDAGAPFLTVILNNQGYRASKNPVTMLFPEGASVRAADFSGTTLNAPPDYARLGRACHAEGIRVEDPGELESAIQRALAAVTAGRCAIVDVILDPI